MHVRVLASAALLLALAGCLDAQPCADGVMAQPVPGHAIAVSWEAAVNATGYLVFRATDDGAPEMVAEVDATATSFTDTNVTAGHAYTYVVATAEGAPLEGCSSAQAGLADASVPFFAGPGLALAAAGAVLGAFLILRHRRT
ncbi:MAG: hypothetical protein ABR586_03910 [Thermoplasmatota archaeon]